MKIQYKNTGTIYDLYYKTSNGRQLFGTYSNPLKFNTSVRFYYPTQTPFNKADKYEIELYAKVIIYMITGALTLQLVVAFLMNKTVMPFFIIIISWQHIFFTCCNDAFYS